MNARFYDLPTTLDADIAKLEGHIADFKADKITKAQFKGIRVGYGIYEQREEDTYMMRIRTPMGALTPEQLICVAEISRDHGVETFCLTTRQEFQVKYIQLEELIPIYKKLSSVGLSGRAGGGNCVRNMVGSYDSGVNPDEVFDVTPYVSALTTRMIAENDSYDLPRKLKFAFSSGPADTAAAQKHCVGFIAKEQDGQRGFAVYVAGGTGSSAKKGKLILEWVPDHRVYYVAKAVKQMFDRYGNRRQRNRAKIKWLWEKLGAEKFEATFFRFYALIQQEQGLELQLAPIQNQSEVKSGYQPEEPKDQAAFELWKKRHVSAQKQTGLFQVRIPFLHGEVANEDGIQLGEFLKNLGQNVIRLSNDQNLNLRNIPEAYLANVFNQVLELKSLSDKPVVLGKMIACTGAATCTLGVTLSRAAAEAVQTELLKRGLDLDKYPEVKIHLSGCANGCANNWTADIGLFGRADKKEHELYPAYMIQLGGAINEEGIFFADKVANVAARHLPSLMADFLEDYEKYQSAQPLKEYLKGEAAKEKLLTLSEAYLAKVPTYAQEPGFYDDLGDDQKFSLLKGKKAECSAGLFDMIELDYQGMESWQNKLENTQDQELKEEAAYNIMVHAAHALLVTRGIESYEDQEVFSNFIEHFIKVNLVPARFIGLVESAKAGDRSALADQPKELAALAEHMRELYNSMDDSLRFNLPEVEATPKAQEPQSRFIAPKADKRMDFTGVACPMNFVKTKLAMAPMQSGQTLEILLDDGEPIANVPESVKMEGHEILHQEPIEGDSWSVLIKKA